MTKLLLNRYLLSLLFLSVWSVSTFATIHHSSDAYENRKSAPTVVELYNQATRQILALSQHNVGAAYANGNGVEQDYTKAFE